MRTAARSFKGYVTKPQLRRKQRLHAQREVEERVQAGDAASGPREEREKRVDAATGPREEHVGQYVDGQTAR